MTEKASVSQKQKSPLEKQEQFPRLRAQNAGSLGSFGAQDSLERINSLPKGQYRGGDLNFELESKFRRNIGRFSHDYNRDFSANIQGSMPKSKFNSDSLKLAQRDSLGTFNQRQKGGNSLFQDQYLGRAFPSRNEMRETFPKSNAFDKLSLESPEQHNSQRYHNDTLPESIFDSPEPIDEYFGGPQKRVQKESLRSGVIRYDKEDRSRTNSN